MTYTHLLDLPPSPGNPRNSEGAFLPLADGRIAWLYSRYRGTSSDDHAYAEIAAIYYDGKSFSAPEILVKPTPGTDETNCMSVSAARMDNGDAAVFYLIKHRGIWSEYVMRRSPDDFRTLGEPVRVLSPFYPAYYVVNNDRVIRTSDGRWLTAAAWTASVMGYFGQRDRVDSREKIAVYESRDDGRSWTQISDFLSLPGGNRSRTGLQEPGLAELPNGVLYAYFRTDLGRHYESFSPDGGRTWSAPEPSPFTGPASPLLVKRNPYSGRYLAVWNPVPEVPFRYLNGKAPSVWTGGRTPLVLAESENGLDWGEPAVIEDDPEAGFCYPAVYFTGEREFLLSYCAGSGAKGDGMCLVRSRIAKIALA
ncbi:MAG: exo-alpha-sialidase [Clostridia bacterium]|nr:exo-alpha-sialidase [Clostridia bacterium]